MRISPVLLVACAAGNVYASSAKQTQDLITEALNRIAALTQNVTSYIEMVSSSNLSTALPVQSATTYLLTYIGNATDVVKADDANLTIAGGQYVGAPTQGLAYKVNESIATLIQKKPDFEKLDLNSLVLTSLQQQLNASLAFSSAVLAKIPSDLVPVANALTGQVTKSLNQGLDCFSGKNETCNPNVVNATRTLAAAQDTGAQLPGLSAVPSLSGSHRTMAQVGGWAVVLGAAFVAFAVGV